MQLTIDKQFLDQFMSSFENYRIKFNYSYDLSHCPVAEHLWSKFFSSHLAAFLYGRKLTIELEELLNGTFNDDILKQSNELYNEFISMMTKLNNDHFIFYYDLFSSKLIAEQMIKQFWRQSMKKCLLEIVKQPEQETQEPEETIQQQELRISPTLQLPQVHDIQADDEVSFVGFKRKLNTPTPEEDEIIFLGITRQRKEHILYVEEDINEIGSQSPILKF